MNKWPAGEKNGESGEEDSESEPFGWYHGHASSTPGHSRHSGRDDDGSGGADFFAGSGVPVI